MKQHTIPKSIHIWAVLLFTLLLASCSVTKYVPEDRYLLDGVNIKTKTSGINGTDLEIYLAQQPNFKVFGLTRLKLHLYSMSGQDTSKRINRWLRNAGEPPVLFDSAKTIKSRAKLQQYFYSKGYLKAKVTDSVSFTGKKAKVYYFVEENNPYRVRNVAFDFHNDTLLGSLISTYKRSSTKLHSGMLFDTDVLNEERTRMANIAKRRGYFKFNKESISYLVDSSLRSNQVDLTLVLRPAYKKLPDGDQVEIPHSRYMVKDVNVLTLPKSTSRAMSLDNYDSTSIKDNVHLYYEHKPLIRKSVIDDNLRINPGMWYNEGYNSRTYTKLSQLGIVRSADVTFVEKPDTGDNHFLTCNIILQPEKKHSFSLDVEGTNSAGDLGFAVSGGLQHRNLFRGAEELSLKARVAEEAISQSGNGLTGWDDHVLEYETELSLKFPRFMFPFLSQNFKHKINSSTEFTVAYNDQRRPEYDRTIMTAGVKYLWTMQRYYNFNIDLFDVNYVRIPSISQKFLDQYSDARYSVLRYSYTPHFIVNTGASISFSDELNSKRLNKRAFKFAFEMAGNLFYLISNLSGQTKTDGQYELFGVPYSQYVRGEFDYSYNKYINANNHFVLHGRLGLECPYGNSEAVPYEKRFFSGGANAVRGWPVRTLGPGSYKAPNSRDFVSQSGNIELTMNAEYRSKLFWRFEGAAFVDGGNIWNIREYDYAPEGTFYLDEFYKQIALAYGLGLRCDFTYFLVRMDLGMKCYDPEAESGDKWRFHDITWKNDFAFHFAIGYPF